MGRPHTRAPSKPEQLTLPRTGVQTCICGGCPECGRSAAERVGLEPGWGEAIAAVTRATGTKAEDIARGIAQGFERGEDER